MPSVVATRTPRTNGLSRNKIAELEGKRRSFVRWPDLDKKGEVKLSRMKEVPKATHMPVTQFTPHETIAELEDLFGPMPKERLSMFAPAKGMAHTPRSGRSGGNRPSDDS